MPDDTYECQAPKEALELLDDLIGKFYNRILELEEQGKLIVKPGDFMKMIELRNKLAPSKSEQQEFWLHIEKIRREHLKKSKASDNARKSKKKSKGNEPQTSDV